jgi:hypothetical protein
MDNLKSPSMAVYVHTPAIRRAVAISITLTTTPANCPKWLYVRNAETGDRSRKSLATPSWAEAQRIAAETLRGMDPEIAAARAVKNDRKDAVTVAEACDLGLSARETNLENTQVCCRNTSG